MLPTDYLKPCTAMIEELIANYRVSAVLCTATQPALRPFFPKERHITELCPRMEEQFRFFKRTTFCDLGTVSKSQLEEHLSAERKALCIVNTRRQAQELYKELKSEGVYHLSTSMYPSHRRRPGGNKKRVWTMEESVLLFPQVWWRQEWIWILIPYTASLQAWIP